MIMLTSTSLKHPTMKAKIIRATDNVIHKGYVVDHVTNRHDVPIMAIRVRPNGKAWVLDGKGNDITQIVANSF